MLAIGEFSKISKVTTKTLRYYDEIGLLKPVQVNCDTGYRYYDVEQLKQVLLINKLKLYCFSLVEIAAVLNRPGDVSFLAHLMGQKQHDMQQKIGEYQFVLGQLDHDAVNLERGISLMSYLDTIPVKLVETQVKNILSIRQKMNVEDYGKYIGKLFERVAKEKLTPLGAPMTIYHDEEYNPESYDMEIAVPVQEAVKGTREFAGELCAMATLKGPYSGLTSVYAKMKEWLEAEAYTAAGAPFEIYVTDPAQTLPEDFVTEVYIPVRK